MKKTIQRFISVAVRMSTDREAHRFAYLLLFSFLAVCPAITRGECVEDTDGEIPFTVTLLQPEPGRSGKPCFWVTEATSRFIFERISKNVDLGDLIPGQACTFYRVKKTIYPHTGRWTVNIDSCTHIPGGHLQTKSFWVNEDTDRVQITIDRPTVRVNYDIQVYVNGTKQTAEAFAEMASEGANTLQQSQAPSPKELQVQAWLGDSQDPSGRPDSDMWSFLGNAGDSLIVRLEPDNKGGHNFGRAILRFVGPPTKQVSGELPKRIDVQLGSAGKYDIQIEQAAGQGMERYTGGYILRIESAQGNIHGLVPAESVEK